MKLERWLDRGEAECLEAVEYVGSANYSERIWDAKCQVMRVFDKLRKSIEVERNVKTI